MAIASVAANAAKQKAASTAAKKMNERKNRGNVPGQGKHSKDFEPGNTTTKSPAKRDRRTVSEKTSDTASSVFGNRPRYWEPRTVAGYRRMLTAEFLVCIGIIFYKAWKTGGNSLTTTGTKSFWREMGAIWLVFFVLALFSSVSWKTARICAMLGGLIMLAMLLKDSQILTNTFKVVQQSPFGTNIAPQSQE